MFWNEKKSDAYGTTSIAPRKIFTQDPRLAVLQDPRLTPRGSQLVAASFLGRDRFHHAFQVEAAWFLPRWELAEAL